MDSYLLQFAVLTGVLGFAAVASIALRLPVVPLYIVAGIVLGGFLPHSEPVRFLGSLGVVFLLFSMGLEFSFSGGSGAGRLLRAGSLDLLVNFPLGLLVGRALGWSWEESLFLAGIVYMTSSAVVTKCIVDFGRAARPETETILGIMVFEDFVIALYLVVLTALIPPQLGGTSLHPALAILRSALFIGALVLAAWRLQGPIERVLAARTEEAFTLLLFTFVLLIAAIAHGSGLSEEIGAFLAGLVLGRTGLKERAAQTLLPFQTLFAALFFVSFGMGLEPAGFFVVLVPAFFLILLGLASKTLGGFLAGRAAGHDRRQAAVVGLSLVPKGEFSIVLASLAAAARPESSIEALAGLYVLGLAVAGPVLMREADRLRDLVFPRRPPPKRAREAAKAEASPVSRPDAPTPPA